MTDEEMADDYAITNWEWYQEGQGGIRMTDEEKLAERYVNGIPIFAEEGEGFSRTQMQQAFLAGLKAGRPKWHKVADGDLPKNENDVLVYSGEEWRMCVGRYSPKNKAWEAGCDTVAWCELPEYKEELCFSMF